MREHTEEGEASAHATPGLFAFPSRHFFWLRGVQRDRRITECCFILILIIVMCRPRTAGSRYQSSGIPLTPVSRQ